MKLRFEVGGKVDRFATASGRSPPGHSILRSSQLLLASSGSDLQLSIFDQVLLALDGVVVEALRGGDADHDRRVLQYLTLLLALRITRKPARTGIASPFLRSSRGR